MTGIPLQHGMYKHIHTILMVGCYFRFSNEQITRFKPDPFTKIPLIDFRLVFNWALLDLNKFSYVLYLSFVV